MERLAVLVVLIARLLPLAVALPCAALTPVQSLDDTVRTSDWIFVGRITAIDDLPSLHGANGPLRKISLVVESALCGRPEAMGLEKDHLEFLYNLEFIERPDFKSGSRFVFFWRNLENGPALAPEYYGALPVVSGKVALSIFDHAPVTLEEFRNRVHCAEH